MYSRKFALAAVSTVVFAAGLSSYAQTSRGTLAGIARDKTGAVIPNAKVSIIDEATGATRHDTTKNDGSFRFDSLSPGPYTIQVSGASGFQSYEVKGVQVAAVIVTSYDVTVQVNNANDVVTVEADNATVNTENGQLAGTINSAEINKLPIFSLNPIELATTVPGVQTVTLGGAQGQAIQVNGARPRSNNFLLDGQEINDVSVTGQAFSPIIPDIFSSVNVITNSASAEFGRAGGGIVNLVTKSGTNSFHGSAFERYFGSGLNSLPQNLRGTGATNPRTDEHSYGFTAGGPILKDKLFAFGALEIQRNYGNEQAGINLLPDAAGYATLQSLQGPAAAQVAALDKYLSNGAYLASSIHYGTPADPNGAVTTKSLGTQAGCASNPCNVTFAGYQRPIQPFSEPDTQWMYRIDYQPWEKDSFSFRYLHDRNSFSPDFSNSPDALAGFDTQVGGPTELGAGEWTHIFNSNLLNEFRVSEARLNFQFAPTAATQANPLNSLPTFTFSGLSGTTTGGAATFPSLGPNQNFPQGRAEDLYQFQDTVSFTRGLHTMRFGADIGRLIEIDFISQNALGTLTFQSGGSGGSSLGNFLLNQLGPSGTATKTFGKTRADSHGYRSGFFFQDDYKATADLTVNIGLRYDYLSNPENSLAFPGVNPSNIFAPINTVVPINNDTNNISPRIGFAYSPHSGFGFLSDGKTVIRGGFGIFYDSTFSNILVNTAQSAPNAVAGQLVQTTGNGLGNATSLIGSISATLSPLSAVTSEVNNLVNPVTYQYNLGVEREIPGAIVLAVRYVGNSGKKLFANQQYNYFSGITGTRLNPARGVVTARGNFAGSNYNGLEVSGSHNFKHGLDIRANYVFSKDLDNSSDIFNFTGGSGVAPTSYTANLAPGGQRQDYGNSTFDHRQYFSIAYVWQPKGFQVQNTFANAAVGILTRHWTLSGVTQLQSGGYGSFNTTGLDLNGDGSAANDRPIVVNKAASLQSVGLDGHFANAYCGGSGAAALGTGSFYDTNQCLNNGMPVPVTANSVHFLVPYFPNNSFLPQEIGRNSFQLPGSTVNNVALEKGIGLSYLHFERGTLILRAEAQNIGNHNDSQVGDLDVLDSGAGFATPSRGNLNQTTSQRVLILWGKLQF